ncbi:hypothetical protein [Planomicrobium sp. CPCC 101110]|uniref:hypothetical protein n=1 Tax=Planomicrobium sp. CPCC 101110 TaxID=2599619 RepID=UPI0011B43960|nr:hypothetical protein [Planomicrobium sp. CPCC 101110]TWT25141.1 hypothetical protein FQV30_12260 [Planomicrobium sp. CPCC 101110]
MSLFVKGRSYYFTRVKDTYVEEGTVYITLFARLLVKTAAKTKTTWVEIEEVKWEQASGKLQGMHNSMHTYLISENIFLELLRVSAVCHRELYFLTPIYQTKKRVQLK